MICSISREPISPDRTDSTKRAATPKLRTFELAFTGDLFWVPLLGLGFNPCATYVKINLDLQSDLDIDEGVRVKIQSKATGSAILIFSVN